MPRHFEYLKPDIKMLSVVIALGSLPWASSLHACLFILFLFKLAMRFLSHLWWRFESADSTAWSLLSRGSKTAEFSWCPVDFVYITIYSDSRALPPLVFNTKDTSLHIWKNSILYTSELPATWHHTGAFTVPFLVLGKNIFLVRQACLDT